MLRRSGWLVAGFAGVALLVPWGLRAADKPDGKSQDAEQAKVKEQAEYYEMYKMLADTISQIEQNYVEEVDRRELMEAAVRGVLEKLDPYSDYISPEDLSRFRTSVENEFGGIGIQITMDRGRLKVLSPLVGTPAYNAGVQAGDWLVEIDGEPTEGINMDEAVRRLKGEPNTDVSITFVHSGETERRNATLTREVIHVETVLGDQRRESDDRWDFMLDRSKKIGYIRLTAFSRDTAEELESALKTLKKQGLRGLILDLRFNPGGLLKSATDIADLFVSDGLIVTTRGRNTKPREVVARKAGTYEDFPIAVLVNRYSASASEIVSACLQDHARAVVIGERTWGKGSVQNVIDLEGGRSALKLTTASYWRPSGKNIHRFPNAKESDAWGVMPDAGYEIKLTDVELRDLVRDRRDRDVVKVSHAPAAIKPEAQVPAKKADEKPADKPAAGGQSSVKPGEVPQTQPMRDAEKPANPADKPLVVPIEPDVEASAAKPFVDRQLQKAIEYVTAEMDATAAAPKT